MAVQPKHYSENHWLLDRDPENALNAYLEQQSKAYSRVKNDFIKELLGDLDGKRFLDYGCGAGFFSVYAAHGGARVVLGVDALDTALSTAAFYARQEGVDRVCQFLRSSIFPQNLGLHKFDVILMKDVVEHVTDDLALLDAAREALIPGGILVISTQNRISLNYLFQGTYNRHVLRDKTWYGWDETHLRFYSPIGLNKRLKKAGFSAVAWRSVYLVPYKLPGLPRSPRKFLRLDALSHVDRLLGGIFPYNRLGWNVVVKAVTSSLVGQGEAQRLASIDDPSVSPAMFLNAP